MFKILEQSLGSHWSIAVDRVRASQWRLRGAKMGKKSRVGRGCLIERPWLFHTGERAWIEPYTYIKIVSSQASVDLGEQVFIGFSSEFNIIGKLSVGNNVLLGPGCFIVDHNHIHKQSKFIADQGCEYKPVSIEDDVWLGAKSIILPGVTLRKGSIVAAGAVVKDDVESMAIVAGVPARIVSYRC